MQAVDGPLPPRAGVGLKPEHYSEILETAPDIGWFEIHAENYMGEGGAPHHYLGAIRELYPLSLHGVGLSIGGNGALDREHLGRLKALIERYQPSLFSEHLAWRAMRASISTICCRCLTLKRRWRGFASISTRCRRRFSGRCCLRTPQPMSPSPTRR
jgi:hypothetical protein